VTCDERQRLRILYNAAAEHYTACVNEVNRVRGKTTKQEYDRARALVDEARNARNAARLSLEQHKTQHGC
jgi:hypothetical protein